MRRLSSLGLAVVVGIAPCPVFVRAIALYEKSGYLPDDGASGRPVAESQRALEGDRLYWKTL